MPLSAGVRLSGLGLPASATSTLDRSPHRHLGPYLGEINRNLAA